ncbi:histidine kinase [Prauserella marina]|uniref:histidine kinase n=1 Tax=Prauserella marina TaxID=530584 RepID=A0A222VRH1_9PSEU|nr:ATP-binding protein [Prauserella marina]ASR36517.1 histidine kinase [Prauserella marina]PWV73905.1 histidine kinase/DNA gyrase B/HSP90-like ATPase [Prauserella marina]SDD58632.1 Histidine kinase-, DNA gyrase B-, and HSP90-like ATPase [Prauserella marina]
MARRARARDLLDRSRLLLDRSRVAAAHILDPPRHEPPDRLAIGAVPAGQPGDPVVAGESAQHTPEALVDICASIALRDLNLVDSLLSQLEEMETKEEDEERLGQLYRLDHLATRLRRNAENLRVLAGRDASDSSADTASLVDAVRGAMSSIDQYSRITIGRVVSLGVVGFAAEDLSRLLAELLDNAANQSPPNSLVRVSAHLTEQGSVLLRIEDEGIGLPPERLEELNNRLANAPVLDDDSVRHMGLAVVRRLAVRHDMRVSLDRRLPHGTTATVLVPSSLVAELPEASWTGAQTVVLGQSGRHARNWLPEHIEEPVHNNSGSLPAPVPSPSSHDEQGATGGGLPRRTPSRSADEAPAPRRRPSPTPVIGGTTASGLPRRVSKSLKNPTGNKEGEAAPALSGDLDAIDEAGQDQLLADLGAFSDGEQAAQDEHDARGAHSERGEGSSGEADTSTEGKQQ